MSLPVRFNDGQEVPDRLLGKAVNEVVNRFAAVTFDCQEVEGRWRHEGIEYRDNLVRIVVDVPDTVSNRKWMKLFKAKWKERLKQVEIWMVSYRIQVE